MWGKVRSGTMFLYLSGITPTHVGKREATAQRIARPWDHPHPCGEKIP